MASKKNDGRGRPRKLTTNQVRSIRGSRFVNTTKKEIAKTFGICHKTVSDVLSRDGAYKNVD